MDWIDKLERRWGRYGIPNLINILLAGQLITGIIALVFNAGVLFDLLLFRDAVLHGRIWQLITFLFYPTWIGGFLGILNLFFYFWLGNALTRYWGDFRMTLFIALGVVGCWLGAFFDGRRHLGRDLPEFGVCLRLAVARPGRAAVRHHPLQDEVPGLAGTGLLAVVLPARRQPGRTAQPGAGAGGLPGLLRAGGL